MTNNQDPSGTVQYPRGIVMIGNSLASLAPVSGWTRCEVNNNNLSAADTFQVTFSLSNLPAGFNQSQLITPQALYVSVWLGAVQNPESFGTSDLRCFIVGRTDNVEFDPAVAEITLSGRDLTCLLSDVKSTRNFVNQTSSAVALSLAKKYGLKPEVTATDVPLGSFQKLEYRLITEQRTDWDTLQYLAQLEDFVCWVRGTTLYFGPRLSGPPTPWKIQWSPPNSSRGNAISNVQRLEFCRSLNVSRGVEVIVMSWNPNQQKSFTGYFPLAPEKDVDPNTVSFGDALVYRYSIHGLTQEQCNLRAESLHKQIIQHEVGLQAEMPGDVVLDMDSVLNVVGTGTAYDQAYFPDSITRRLDFDDGFTMSVRGKNSAMEVQVAR